MNSRHAERPGRRGRAARPAARLAARIAGMLAAALLAATTGGCIKLAVLLLEPDPVAPAEFKLTGGRLLVLVDESQQERPDPSIRNQLVRDLTDQLRMKTISNQIIPDDEVRRVLKTRPVAAQWTPAQLGKALHAEQVLHVQLEPYVSSRGEEMDPSAWSRLSAFVKVVDVVNDEQVWPKDRAGREVAFEMKANAITTSEPGPDLRKTLAQGLADRVVKLFYEHKIDDYERFRRETEQTEGR